LCLPWVFTGGDCRLKTLLISLPDYLRIVDLRRQRQAIAFTPGLAGYKFTVRGVNKCSKIAVGWMSLLHL
jgi:hypothetical protein